MINQLTDIEVAKLQGYFVLPLAVQKMVMANKPLEADEEYALHESLADMQPDSALIAIALCSRYLGYAVGGKQGQKLLNHAAFIVGEYGSAWMAHAEECSMESEIVESAGSSLDDTILMDLLIDTPEDLSSMAMLLTECAEMIGDKDNILARLCQVLAIQAASQSDIAELYVDAVMQSRGKRPLDSISGQISPLDMEGSQIVSSSGQELDFAGLTAPKEDNVVSFPIGNKVSELAHV